MQYYIVILDITIEKLIERIRHHFPKKKMRCINMTVDNYVINALMAAPLTVITNECKSDIVIITIIKVFQNCCNKIFEYLEKDDIKIKGELKDDDVHIRVTMEYSVYVRKIGKYVKDQRFKILDDLGILIRSELEKLDWKEILEK